MKIGIKYRLFLGMLAATATVVLCMWLIMQWSINRGFLRYVNIVEQQRLESLAFELERAYGEWGNWEFLQSEPNAWFELLVRSLPSHMADPEQIRRLQRRLERFRTQEADPQDEERTTRSWLFELRVKLLDAERQAVIMPRGNDVSIELKTLRHNDNVIGYLGLLPRPRTYDSHQLQFVRQQKLTLALIAGAALLVSALIAMPLAERLVRPLKALAQAANRLAQGAYQTRVPVRGQDEIGQLSRDFNTLALTLEKNEEARRQWVADISHELRTPLSVLRGEIEALQDGIRPTNPEALQSLHAEVLHLGRLVDDLYQLSLSDLGALNYRKNTLDLTAALREALLPFQPRFANKNIELTTRLPSYVIEINADAERLHQLFYNILDNTLKYTDAGGHVEIELVVEKTLARIHVRDSSPGVPAAEMGRIFDRLYRLESSRRRAAGGAGLGLAICRNIVEAHEGRISAQESPLGGLWIAIELPLTGDTP